MIVVASRGGVCWMIGWRGSPARAVCCRKAGWCVCLTVCFVSGSAGDHGLWRVVFTEARPHVLLLVLLLLALLGEEGGDCREKANNDLCWSSSTVTPWKGKANVLMQRQAAGCVA
jgi:hypothetical protein